MMLASIPFPPDSDNFTLIDIQNMPPGVPALLPKAEKDLWGVVPLAKPYALWEMDMQAEKRLPDVEFFCTLGGQTHWNALGRIVVEDIELQDIYQDVVMSAGPICISPFFAKGDGTCENRLYVPPFELVLLDCGAFARNKKKVPFDEIQDRQMKHAKKYGYPHNVWQLASPDVLIPEKYLDGRRDDDYSQAVEDTIDGAKWLAEHRQHPEIKRKSEACVFTAQGASPQQFLYCAEEILPLVEEEDMFGIGGFAFLGKQPAQWMPIFRALIHQLIPMIARQFPRVRRIHIWGCCYDQALLELLWLCKQYGLQLSTDSSMPALKPLNGKWGYSYWNDTSFKHQVIPEINRFAFGMSDFGKIERWYEDTYGDCEPLFYDMTQHPYLETMLCTAPFGGKVVVARDMGSVRKAHVEEVRRWLFLLSETPTYDPDLYESHAKLYNRHASLSSR